MLANLTNSWIIYTMAKKVEILHKYEIKWIFLIECIILQKD